MKRLLRKSLRDPLPNYKKRVFEQMVDKLAAKNLISKQIQTDVISGQKKILISLSKADKDQDNTISDSDVTILLFYAYCPQPMTRGNSGKLIISMNECIFIFMHYCDGYSGARPSHCLLLSEIVYPWGHGSPTYRQRGAPIQL